MFADACENMMKCTFPLISSKHMVDGSSSSGIGTFVVINPDGWAITAAHVLIEMVQHRESVRKLNELREWNSSHPEEIRTPDPKWSDHHSIWLGIPGAEIETAYLNTEIDLAVFKMKNFRKDSVKYYPTFKDPSKLRVGTSICRLGFPFTDAATTFNDEKKLFMINPGVLPVPFFPNDGMYTRNVVEGKTKDEDAFDKMFLETTTPGLRGQSGGPIFDRFGNIMGIQARTVHMRTGFRPKAGPNDPPTEQFMNLGLGVHVRTIIQVLERKGVKYKSESDDDGYRIIE